MNYHQWSHLALVVSCALWTYEVSAAASFRKAQENGATALHYAFDAAHAQALIEGKADVNAQDPNGQKPLDYMIKRKLTKQAPSHAIDAIIRVLYQHGAYIECE